MPFNISRFIENPGQRLPIRLVLEGSWSDGGIRTVDRITLDGVGFLQLDTLYIEATVGGRVTTPCRRCLRPVTELTERSEEFEVRVPIGADEVDIESPLLRLILSGHDPNVLCKEDCRGLCPVCGANLNDEPDHKCRLPEDEHITLRELLR